MDFEIPENPEYSKNLRKLQKSDPAHADLFNDSFKKLITNDAFMKKMMPAVGICRTAKGTAEKTVDCPDFRPYDGARIMVTFTQGSSTNYMTLNVNGTGGAAVWFPVGETRTYNNEAIAKFIAAGCAYEFIYQEGDTPKWVYCGIVSTADTLGAVKKTGDTMTGDLAVPAVNLMRFLRCSDDTTIESAMDYIGDWQHLLICAGDWSCPIAPDKNSFFVFGGKDVLTAISYTGKIFHTESDGDGKRWVQVGLSKAEAEAGFLPVTGGRVTGSIAMPAAGTMIYGEEISDQKHNHALQIGHGGQDYWNFYEYGGVFNFYRSQDNSDTLLGRITENGWEGDASRSDGLQSFREDMSRYNRGEYVIRSVFNNPENRFYLKCFNDNSDTGRHDMGVDYAVSSGSANASQYLKTFSAIGEGHGDAHLLKCQHNLYGDGYFGFAVDGGHKVEVDHALAATRDGVGNIITDTYMPKSGGTFTNPIAVSGPINSYYSDDRYIELDGDTINLGGWRLKVSPYDGEYGSIWFECNISSGGETHLDINPRFTQNANMAYSDAYLGDSAYPWWGVYMKNGSILTSDRKQKTDIRPLDPEVSRSFIRGLKPSSYKMIDGRSGRTHYGMIAQDIEELMDELGMSSLDFAGFIKSPKVKEIWEDEYGEKLDKPIKEVAEGEFDYALRYDEFIAPIITFIQYLDDNVNNLTKEMGNLRKENAELRQRLEALEKIILKAGGADGT